MAWRPPPRARPLPLLASASIVPGRGASDIDSSACGGKDTKTTAFNTEATASRRGMRLFATKSCGAHSRAQSPPPTRSNRGRSQSLDMPERRCWDERTGDRVITSTTHKPPLHPRHACPIPDRNVLGPVALILHRCVTFYVVVLACVYDHILLTHIQSVHRRRQAERRADMSVAVHSKITPRPTRSLYTSITLPYLFLCSISPLAVFASRESCLLPPESQLLPPPTLLAKFVVLWLA